MSSCVIPGSFDPLTIGHMDLIERAAKLFDRVTVVVMVNIHKQGVFSPDERVRLIQKACADLPGVRVEKWSGLLNEYMREKGEKIVIRGARGMAEYDGETAAAAANRMLNPEMETLLMPAAGDLACISSSMVREVAAFGGDVKKLVPEKIAEEIAKALAK